MSVIADKQLWFSQRSGKMSILLPQKMGEIFSIWENQDTSHTILEMDIANKYLSQK